MAEMNERRKKMMRVTNNNVCTDRALIESAKCVHMPPFQYNCSGNQLLLSKFTDLSTHTQGAKNGFKTWKLEMTLLNASYVQWLRVFAGNGMPVHNTHIFWSEEKKELFLCSLLFSYSSFLNITHSLSIFANWSRIENAFAITWQNIHFQRWK